MNCKTEKRKNTWKYFTSFWHCNECDPGYHLVTCDHGPQKNIKVTCENDTPTPTDTPTDAPTDNPCYPHWHLEDGACVCDLGYHLECHQHGRVCTCKENQCSPAQCRH